MGYEERKDLYDEIEDHRDRPLITYVTSTRPGASGQMLRGAIAHVMRQLTALRKRDEEHDEVDLLAVSIGGDPTVSWRVNSLIREHFDKYNILLPDTAHSAATLLALGADNIVMHAFANLGPVDPQIPYFHDEVGQQRRFSSEDLRHFVEFVREEVGISDQSELESAFEFAADEIGPTKIGNARRSSYLSMSMAEKLLNQHMEDEKQASAIAEELNRSFYHHGYPLGRREAKKIGLTVQDPDPTTGELIRDVWRDFEDEMKCNEPFRPTDIVLQSDQASDLLDSISHVDLPSGMSDRYLQQFFQQLVSNNLLQGTYQTVEIEPVDYELFFAAVESSRAYSHNRQDGKIFAQRLPDGTVQSTQVPVSRGWQHEPDPE